MQVQLFHTYSHKHMLSRCVGATLLVEKYLDLNFFKSFFPREKPKCPLWGLLFSWKNTEQIFSLKNKLEESDKTQPNLDNVLRQF